MDIIERARRFVDSSEILDGQTDTEQAKEIVRGLLTEIELLKAEGQGMNESGLRPCPFCGKEVKIEEFTVNYPFTFTDAGFEIRCEDCGVRFRESTRCLPGGNKEDDERAKAELIKRWNARNDGDAE